MWADLFSLKISHVVLKVRSSWFNSSWRSFINWLLLISSNFVMSISLRFWVFMVFWIWFFFFPRDRRRLGPLLICIGDHRPPSISVFCLHDYIYWSVHFHPPCHAVCDLPLPAACSGTFYFSAFDMVLLKFFSSHNTPKNLACRDLILLFRHSPLLISSKILLLVLFATLGFSSFF